MSQAGTTEAARASARLGLTLRLVLLSPDRGFESALRAADRRERAGLRPAEGAAPYVLAAVGGASILLLWLKVGGLAGLRDSTGADYRPVYLAMTILLGGLLGLLGQFVCGAIAPRVPAFGRTRARSVRIVWGLAALPQVVTLAVLLPLDLAVVGRETFVTDRLADPLSTAWAAFSIALGAAFALWSIYLFFRGVSVATEGGRLRVILAASISIVVGIAAFTPVVVASKLTA